MFTTTVSKLCTGSASSPPSEQGTQPVSASDGGSAGAPVSASEEREREKERGIVNALSVPSVVAQPSPSPFRKTFPKVSMPVIARSSCFFLFYDGMADVWLHGMRSFVMSCVAARGVKVSPLFERDMHPCHACIHACMLPFVRSGVRVVWCSVSPFEWMPQALQALVSPSASGGSGGTFFWVSQYSTVQYLFFSFHDSSLRRAVSPTDRHVSPPPAATPPRWRWPCAF